MRRPGLLRALADASAKRLALSLSLSLPLPPFPLSLSDATRPAALLLDVETSPRGIRRIRRFSCMEIFRCVGWIPTESLILDVLTWSCQARRGTVRYPEPTLAELLRVLLLFDAGLCWDYLIE